VPQKRTNPRISTTTQTRIEREIPAQPRPVKEQVRKKEKKKERKKKKKVQSPESMRITNYPAKKT